MPDTPEQPLPRSPYRNLVLLALLTLSGSREPHGLLEHSHRLVTGALPRGRRHPRPHDYPRVRRRVLRRALLPRGWHPRGRAGLRVSPLDGVGAEARALEALAGLDSADRAAYALLKVEGLDTQQASEVLSAAGIRDAATAVERAQRVLEPPHLPDPTVVRVSGRGALVHRRGLAAAAGLLLFGASALGLATAGPDGGVVVPTVAAPPAQLSEPTAPDTWRKSFRLDLTAWHPRGDAADDGDLTQRALAAWIEQEGQAGSDTPDSPALLFAGDVADSDVVLLHDGPRVARYTHQDGDERVEVFAEPGNGVANWPALRLADTEEGTHYLLPPWIVEADTAPLGEDGADWSPIEHEDGVTEALSTGEHCDVGPVLRLRAPEVAHGEPYTAIDLGGLDTAHLGYMPPPPADIRRLGPHEVLGPEQGFDLWGELACAGDPPEDPIRTATAWEFAVQDLPGGGTGRWSCVRFGGHDGGGLARAVLVAETDDGTEATVAGEREGGWDCSNLNRQVVAGTWWQDPDDRWNYLAAGSRETAALTAEGGADGSSEDGETVLEVEGPVAEAHPADEVDLSAVDVHGDEMTVLAR
ncbi:hypothetical protein [Nocardiopsis nanhaiensis]